MTAAGLRPAVFGVLVTTAVAAGAAGACSGGDGAPSPGAAPTARSTTSTAPADAPGDVRLEEYGVPAGSRPHDVAVAADGTVWYTAQGSGGLGRLDPATGGAESAADKLVVARSER